MWIKPKNFWTSGEPREMRMFGLGIESSFLRHNLRQVRTAPLYVCNKNFLRGRFPASTSNIFLIQHRWESEYDALHISGAIQGNFGSSKNNECKICGHHFKSVYGNERELE